jgi:AGZA family xanthine/uracil permease-like MFS transporter
VAITFIPVVAAVVLLEGGSLLAGAGRSAADLQGDARATWQTLLVLGNGFILTAVLWGSALAAILDRRFATAGLVFTVASAATLFGLVHSPLASGALFWPWSVPSEVPLRMAGAYGVLAVICWLAERRAPRAR